MREFIQKMALSSSLHDLKQIMIRYFAQEGIFSIALTLYQNHTKTGSRVLYDWVTPPLKPWHDYYLEQQYADIDRTLEFSEHSLIPIFWDVQQQLMQAKNNRERRMRRESIEFGIDKELSIPCYGPRGDFMILVLHQHLHQQGLAAWQSKHYQWVCLSQYYFHYLRHFLLRKDNAGQIHLTRREQQCLELTAKGVRLGGIAKTLGIKERTCHFHLQNANKKLGVSNKYLAINRWQEMRDKLE
jgi:LuxR family transcriptional activator of bioluminescence operon